MFEVGKKYVNTNWPNELYECVAIHEKKGWLLFNGKPLTYDWPGNWKEYKEPRTITRWVNVYGGKELAVGRLYDNREEAVKNGKAISGCAYPYLNTISISYTESL